MRAPMSWIRDFVAVPADQTGRDVAARLIAAGLEVETVDVLGADVTGPLVVGRVRSVEELSEFKKPIRYCRVEVGPGNGEDADGVATDERGIICGASNFAAGDLVVVALPGAVLPGGFEIAARPTYGRVSDGMITSERELGLGDDHSGVIVLPAGSGRARRLRLRAPRPGRRGARHRRHAGPRLRAEHPGDRPRGRHGLRAAVRRPCARGSGVPAPGPPRGQPPHECSITDPEAADRFVLRSIAGLDPSAPSPQWMRRALVACGMRPVSLAVDVTNFVMLELGQPLHAFDRAKLTGPLTVRRASAGEPLETLDHVRRTLSAADIVIAEPRGPLALAGTMGGLESEIDEGSHSVAIEAVHFSADAVARMSRRHRLSSEASRRFERGVDPELPAVASARAAALLIELGGASYVGTTRVDAVVPSLPVQMPADLPERVSGMPISADRTIARLESVGATLTVEGATLVVTPPTWRPDLTDPADLVEEVVRLEGYESLPATLPRTRAGYGLSAAQRRRRRAGRTLAASGLVEVLTYPFVSRADLDALGITADDPRSAVVGLANPLSDEVPFLRTTLLPGLARALRRNLSRGAGDVALFEVGLVFQGSASGTSADPPRPSVSGRPSASEVARLEALLPAQPRHAGGILAGERDRSGWWGAGRPAVWSDGVGVVRDLADELGVVIEVAPASTTPWHPGRCAAISVEGAVIGHAGELHPRVLDELGLPPRTVAFEVHLDALLAAAPAVVPAPVFSTMPVAKEDLAVVVGADVAAESVRAAMLRGGGALLESVRLFDTYSGEQVGQGRRSLAFALRMRAPDRTLSAAEVAEVRQRALAAAEAECGAELRS